MKFAIDIFVRDEHENLIARHSFTSANEEKLYAMVESFELALKLYGSQYTVMRTPIGFIRDVNIYECEK